MSNTERTYDYLFKVIMESANTVSKGIPVYVTILAISLGFVLNSDSITYSDKKIMFVGIAAITVASLIFWSAIGYFVIYQGAKDLQSLVLELNTESENQILRAFNGKLKRAFVICGIMGSFTMFVFLLGLVFLFYRV